MPPLLAVALGLSRRDDVADALPAMIKVRDRYAEMLWREHLYQSGKDGSPADRYERELLKKRWAALWGELGNAEDSAGRTMCRPGDAMLDRRPKMEIQKELKKWERVRNGRARALRDAGQQSLLMMGAVVRRDCAQGWHRS